MSDAPPGDVSDDAARRIAWAARGMPVLSSIQEGLTARGALNGLRIGIGLVLEPKTANLALALQHAGAQVSVHCRGRLTTEGVARALEAAGLQVYAERAATQERDAELARGFFQTGPDILLDDGAELIRLAHREHPDLVEDMLGAAEETTSGVQALRVMHEQGVLKIPVIAVSDSRIKHLFDNVYGTGQSCVMALLDITNLQLAGRLVMVVGYGWVGQGVARHAAALGARVIVSEIDAVKALQALHDGHRVQSLSDAAPDVEIVFAATGVAGAVTRAHVERMQDGVILCTAGGGAFELPMGYLNALGTATEVRPSVTEYATPAGKTVLVIGQGDCLNCSDAEGNPIEVMDLSLSLQAFAAEGIATEGRNWPPGIYPVSPQIETAVAQARLRHEGATLETLTEELFAAMHSW
jgi:adenosylhomocysteinase